MAEPGTSQGDTGAGDGDTSFLDGITDEAMRGNEIFKDFTDLDGLAKSHVGLNQELVDLKASQPTLPENADGYSFQAQDGTELDQEVMGQFRGLAFEHKLTPEQHAAVVNFDLARQAKLTADYNTLNQANVDALKAELGDGWDEALGKANEVLKKVPGGEKLMEATPLDSHPALFTFMVWLGKHISEDVLESGGAGGDGDTRKKDETGRPVLNFDGM